jgi:hypothetical protein
MPSSSASASRVALDWSVSRPLIWIRISPLSPRVCTSAELPEVSSATSRASSTETLVAGVVNTAPPSNSTPMCRPRSHRPEKARMVMRIDTQYQIFRLPTKSTPTSPR